VACIVVFGVFISMNSFIQESSAEARYINAQGTAKKYFEPDQVYIIIKIERRNDSAAIAKNLTAIIIQDVLDSLKELGIKDENIETTNYRVFQNYIWVNNTKVWTDFSATCTIKVTTKDFEKAGLITDKSVQAGALINSIDFEISNEKINDYKTIVMGEAAKDARNKAEAVVLSLSHKIGDVVSISFDYGYKPYRYWSYGEGLTRTHISSDEYKYSPPTQILPEDLSISATLSVEFEIL
jgi:uncharacterized protein YggE